MIIEANCKINIGLDILRRREDGFHDLSTVMYPVRGLYDRLTVERSEAGVQFRGVGMAIDCADDDNLCVRAARLMQQRYDVGGVDITLDKRVPFGAGLGGGSSDATAILLSINEIYNLKLDEQTLIALATELGSDTAFFVRNTPQLCSGRGEIMEPISIDLSGKKIVMIKPEIHISTREAYSGVKPAVPAVALAELISLPIEQWQGRVLNGFEEHLFRAYPLLAEIKSALLSAGAIYAAMSGSGSTIFGLFESADTIKSEQIEIYSPLMYDL